MDKSYLRIRNFLGILGCLLPILSIIGASFSPNVVNYGWWHSISVTYYSSPVLIAVLSAVAFFLMVYRSYSKWDTLVNTFAGIFALGVVIFPCDCKWLEETTKVGLFYLPIYITKWFHYASAFGVFFLLSLNSLFLFTKGNNKLKNKIYKICGIVMIAALALFILNAIIFNISFMVMILETIMLFAFGVSWIIKGHMLDKVLGE